jgi:exosome complex RNA-binding protein Csl4
LDSGKFSCFPGISLRRPHPFTPTHVVRRRSGRGREIREVPSSPWSIRPTTRRTPGRRSRRTPSHGAVPKEPRVRSSPELTTQDQIAERARSVNIRADLFDEDEYDLEEYEALLEMYEDTLTNIEEGEIVKARVLRVTDKVVILDVGFKSEGSVAATSSRTPTSLQVGDEVEVYLENLEDEDGVVVLSKKKADFLRVWEKIREAYESGTRCRACSPARSRAASRST